MLAIALLALVASAVVSYLIGAAFIARRDSTLRKKRSLALLVAAALSLIPLPPQLIGLDGSVGPMSNALTGGLGMDTSGFAWPATLPPNVYLFLWLLSSTTALLIGAQVWRANRPDWRGGLQQSQDFSATGRARGLLPMSDTLPEALDILKRTGVDARGADALAVELRDLGARFSSSLPASSGEVYRMVALALPPAVAAKVTGHLLAGAGRGRSAAAS